MAANRICSIPGCDRRHVARGWCDPHYRRWIAHGDPLAGGTPDGAPMEFIENTAVVYAGDDCLKWPFAQNGNGYGQIWRSGRNVQAHRLICELVNGSPPDPSMDAAHTCGRGHLGCVNPKHLKWATRAENMADKLLHGTHNRGERHSMAKLTESDVRQIRELKGKMTCRELGEMFGVAPITINRAQRGQNWR
jgi:hypothetical protein